MERSGYQKTLKVISIIDIVAGVFAILAGGLFFAGAGLLSSPEMASETATLVNETGLSTEALGGITSAIGFAGVLGGALEILTGVLGLRAAKDSQKIMPVWYLAIISLALNVVSLVTGLFQGQINGSNIVSYITSILFAGLMFWVANNIKAQAGK